MMSDIRTWKKQMEEFFGEKSSHYSDVDIIGLSENGHAKIALDPKSVEPEKNQPIHDSDTPDQIRKNFKELSKNLKVEFVDDFEDYTNVKPKKTDGAKSVLPEGSEHNGESDMNDMRKLMDVIEDSYHNDVKEDEEKVAYDLTAEDIESIMSLILERLEEEIEELSTKASVRFDEHDHVEQAIEDIKEYLDQTVFPPRPTAAGEEALEELVSMIMDEKEEFDFSDPESIADHINTTLHYDKMDMTEDSTKTKHSKSEGVLGAVGGGLVGGAALGPVGAIGGAMLGHTLTDELELDDEFSEDDMQDHGLRRVRVEFDDGGFIDTNVSADVSDDEIRTYYGIGAEFNLGGSEDRMANVVKVEIDNEISEVAPVIGVAARALGGMVGGAARAVGGVVSGAAKAAGSAFGATAANRIADKYLDDDIDGYLEVDEDSLQNGYDDHHISDDEEMNGFPKRADSSRVKGRKFGLRGDNILDEGFERLEKKYKSFFNK